MNTIGLFLAGAAVTVVVAIALGLLVWGAILDGRAAALGQVADATPPIPPSAERRAGRSTTPTPIPAPTRRAW